MIRRITALFFFLGVYVLGFAENTRGREYILVLSSINLIVFQKVCKFRIDYFCNAIFKNE